jgi:hypothetical protein
VTEVSATISAPNASSRCTQALSARRPGSLLAAAAEKVAKCYKLS